MDADEENFRLGSIKDRKAFSPEPIPINVPLDEEITDAFAECALTIQHEYQIMNVRTGEIVVGKIGSIYIPSTYRVEIDFDGVRMKLTYVNGEFLSDPRDNEEFRVEKMRVFKLSPDYEPNMLKGGQGGQITDPYAECALTIGHNYQIIIVDTNKVSVWKLIYIQYDVLDEDEDIGNLMVCFENNNDEKWPIYYDGNKFMFTNKDLENVDLKVGNLEDAGFEVVIFKLPTGGRRKGGRNKTTRRRRKQKRHTKRKAHKARLLK